MTITGFKVEYEPEDPGQLAVELAEAYQGIVECESTAAAFEAQAVNERTKARALTDVIFAANERDRNIRRGEAPVRSRRMDPVAEYDTVALKAQAQELRRRIEMLQTTATDARHKAAKFKNAIPGLQKRIQTANAAWKAQREG